MADEMMLAKAEKVYGDLCSAIDNREWRYDRDDERLVVAFDVGGDDIPMRFVLAVDADRQLVRLMSPMPYKISEEKRIEAAIATCAASYGLGDGSFDFDLTTGEIIFRQTASFRGDSVIGEGLFQYLISWGCAVVDAYNDKFLALDKGHISYTDFIKE